MPLYHGIFPRSRVRKLFKVQDSKYFACGSTVSIATTHLYHCKAKEAIDNPYMNKCGYAPIKLFLIKMSNGPDLAWRP